MKGRRPLNRHRGELNRRSSRLKRRFFEVPYGICTAVPGFPQGDAPTNWRSYGGTVTGNFGIVDPAGIRVRKPQGNTLSPELPHRGPPG
jgi:hypothetical protein